jgi:hypothetical protein
MDGDSTQGARARGLLRSVPIFADLDAEDRIVVGDRCHD